MSTGMIGLLDPASQERIRRGTHKFAADPTRMGVFSYQPDVYHHQEYPKMMLRTPRPQFKEFRKRLLSEQAGDSQLAQLLLGQKLDLQSLYESACQEWDEEAQASIVHSKIQEEKWLEENCLLQQGAETPIVTESTKHRAQELKASRDAQKAELPVTHLRDPRVRS